MGLSETSAFIWSRHQGEFFKAFECEECGAERMETDSGRVCPNFHGRIHRKIPKPILKHLRMLKRAKSLPVVDIVKTRWAERFGDRIRNSNVYLVSGDDGGAVYKPLKAEHLVADGKWSLAADMVRMLKRDGMKLEGYGGVTDCEKRVRLLEASYLGEVIWLYRVGFVERVLKEKG